MEGDDMAIDRTRAWRWLLGCAATLAAPAALAQSSAPGWWFQLGSFRPNVDTTLRVDDAGGGNGTQFDAESVLGLPRRKTLASGLIGVRLGDRWRLEVEHFNLNRSVRQFAITETVVIDDTTFPVSALVDSDFDSKVTRVSGGVSFVKTDNAELGMVIGAHVTTFEVGISGTFSAGGGAPATFRREARDVTVPLPTVGLFGSVALAPGLSLNGRADVFSLSHRDIDGRLLNLQANVTWHFTRNVGIGAGYRHTDYKVESGRSEDFRGRLEYEFSGPQLFVDLRF
jgi:hypothetical protein